MGTEPRSEAALLGIGPMRGGPSLKKHAQLGCSAGVVTGTDRRRRVQSFDLSGSAGPYSFAWGAWDGQSDFALLDNAGQAVLIIDLINWADADITRWQRTTNLAGGRTPGRPPSCPDAISLFDPPYLKWAKWAFYVSVAGFGLWSVTHVDLIIAAVLLPALLIISLCLVLAKQASPRRQELLQQARDLQTNIEELLVEHPELKPDNQQTEQKAPPDGH